MLAVRDLKVRYGAVEAVRGLDLSLARGQLLALLGANGAGKTSTLAAIAGLVPAAGRIEIAGETAGGLPPETLARRGVALVPEGRRLFAGLTVAENLTLGGAVHTPPAERRRRVAAMEERFPVLAERRHQKAGLLSGGEQQMLALARALMAGPRLLLLDEPSLGLAPQMVERVFDIVAGLKAEGLTILLVEQNVPMSLAIADQAVVLANGRAALSGPAAEVAASDHVRRAYLAA
ncbi:MAG: ABC transporter ATP-binding protein [Rhodobacteraceae bacterium]|jgi:branched-chain amino acid transport system ATP-binding protein|nr:ABC transporter ATP-binding protein [Paracoccaceae bacterium]